MRLLSRTDLVKILGNTYYAGATTARTNRSVRVQLTELLDGLALAAQTQPVDPVDRRGRVRPQAYFRTLFQRLRAGPAAAALATGNRRRRLAPGCDSGCARLFRGDLGRSGRLTANTAASPGLQGWSFAGEASAGLDRLLPREQRPDRHADPEGLGDGGGGVLTLTGAGGAQVTCRQ